MLISFLVPVYNTEKYLRRCVDSLLAQQGAPFEIVLLDDGSKDSSPQICEEYRSAYPDIVRVIHKQNEGLLLTRRRGFREAKGDWFICVDSDDYVAPDLLEKVVKAAEDTDADMVMYNFEYFYENGTRACSKLRIPDGSIFQGAGKQGIYEKRLLRVDVNMMWMRAVKREIVDIDADYSTCGIRNMCEDAVQVLPLYTAAQKIVYLDAPLYYYRKGEDSITGRQSMANWDANRICFKMTREYLSLWNVPAEVETQFYTQHLEYLTNYIRWMFSAEENELPATVPELVAALKQGEDFVSSRERYCKKFAHSRYMSIIVPVLVRFIERNNILGIRTVLKLEKQILKIKKK